MTGGKTDGTEAEASMTLRTRSSASGWPLAAIAPMFHSTPRCASRLVVPISSMRPCRYSSAICARVAASMWREIVANSGRVSVIASEKGMLVQSRRRKIWSASVAV